MKKHLAFALPFFITGLLLLAPEASQANIAPKKISQARPAKLTSASRITIEPAEGKEKKRAAKSPSGNKAMRLTEERGAAGRHKVGRKSGKTGKLQVSSRKHKTAVEMRASHVSEEMPVLADVPDLEVLRQHYQDWRGTRYRAGGSSHAGVDCSGFTALTFRDVYGIELPRTAHEQAMQGTPIARDGLLPGDLVFFKRGHGGDHVGIYLGNGKFMHASSHQGVIISSMNNVYWRNKFWRGARLL